MKKSRIFKVISLAMILVLIAAAVSACGGGSSAGSAPAASSSSAKSEAPAKEASAPAEEASAPAEEASAPAEETSAPAEEEPEGPGRFVPADIPEVPDLGGLTSNEWLLETMKTDSVPLGGVQSTHLEDRSGVYKGLDQVDLEDDDVRIAFLIASLGTVFFTSMEESAKKRCDEYGYTLVTYDANFDLTTQQEQLDTVLNADFDFVCINVIDIHAESDYYAKFAEKGIPVLICGASTGSPDYAMITTALGGSWLAGFEVGKYVAEKVWGQYPEGLKWGALLDRLGDDTSESRPNGFMAGYLYKYAELAGQPYDSQWDAAVIAYNAWVEARNTGNTKIPGIIDLVGYVTTNNIATSAAAPAAAELLTAHPDMDLAFVETDSFSTAMVTEMQQRGLVPGEDMLVAYAADGSAEICEAIKEGLIMCTGTNVPDPYAGGLIDIIHSIYTGELSLEDANNLVGSFFLPTYVVSPENIDEVWEDGMPYAAALENWQEQLLTIDEYNAKNE